MPPHGKSAGRRIDDRKKIAGPGGGSTKSQGVPAYVRKDFDRVVYIITYKTFLEHMNTSKSIAGFTRKFAEDEWRKLIRNKWMVWGKHRPEQERNAELHHALSQVDGFPGFDAEEYWNAQPLKTVIVKHTEDEFHDATDLKLPKYEERFEKIALKLGYKEFLKRLDSINDPVVDRSKAEVAWKYFIQLKWYDWKTDLLPGQKEKVLMEALEQTTKGHKGFYKNLMDVYWQEKKKRFGDSQKPISKDVVMKYSSTEGAKNRDNNSKGSKTTDGKAKDTAISNTKLKDARTRQGRFKETKINKAKIKEDKAGEHEGKEMKTKESISKEAKASDNKIMVRKTEVGKAKEVIYKTKEGKAKKRKAQ